MALSVCAVNRQSSSPLSPDSARADAYLNRLLPSDYYRAFAERLEVLLFEGTDINHVRGLEGEELLTSEVSAELAAYPGELLLRRLWCIICKKAS